MLRHKKQPEHHGRNSVEVARGLPMVRRSRRVRLMENDLQQVQSLGSVRTLGQIFFSLRGDVDSEWVFVDGSYVRAHQHASGARRGAERAIGRSRGGPTTKIHMACDAHGNPIDFEITGGEVHDVKAAPEIIRKLESAEQFVGDKGYDSEEIREQVRAKGINPVIPRKSNSKKPNPEFDSFL